MIDVVRNIGGSVDEPLEHKIISSYDRKSPCVCCQKVRIAIQKTRTQTCSHNKLNHKSFLKGKTEHVELNDQQTNKNYLLLVSSVKFKEPPTESMDPQITSPCHYSKFPSCHHENRRGASRQKKNSFAGSWIRSLEPRRWKKEREPCRVGDIFTCEK